MKHLLLTTIAAVLLVGCNNDVEVDISKIIEERHANIDSTSSIQNAAKKGDIEAVKKHLASGVDVNDDGGIGMTALQNAAAFGHSDIVQLLINNGADVNTRNPFNLTPTNQCQRMSDPWRSSPTWISGQQTAHACGASSSTQRPSGAQSG